MFAAATVAILVTMGLALVRAMLGPTVFDRILGVSMISTKTTILIGVIGFLTDRPEFLDIAMVYALINFIGAIAVLKFFKYGTLSSASPIEATPNPDEIQVAAETAPDPGRGAT
jgi:multicomponent Na+:H+ antiporter subunit F